MAVGAEFQAFVLDLLAPLRPNARRMFGGVGLLGEGMMFALLANDAMFFRVDAQTRPAFQDAGCEPFRYQRGGRAVAIESYYMVPDTLYDQPDALVAWAREALAAARRGKSPRPRRAPAR